MARVLSSDLLESISKEYGDAFYVLDSDNFENNYNELTHSFKSIYPRFNIAYSYKTNYTPKLVQIVNRLGGFAEVVSDMEMEIALKSGVPASHIIWNGPIKDENKINELLLAGGTVNIDSIFEMDIIKSIAEKNPSNAIKIGIRCNYDVGDGVLSRFGFDIEGDDFDSVLKNIRDTSNIDLISLQSHFAKRSPEFWSARAEKILGVYDYVVDNYGLIPDRIDIGGGIYGKMPDSLRHQLGIQEITYDDYALKAATAFANHFSNTTNAPWLFIEPGTALAGDSMRFVGRIKTIKEVRGKTIATMIGSQKNISMTGINPPIEIVSGGGEQSDYTNIDIVGYTCIEGDVIQKNYSGSIAVGDYLVISNCGSYSLVMKPPFILPNFPVIDVSEGTIELIKRAETFDDLFQTYTF